MQNIQSLLKNNDDKNDLTCSELAMTNRYWRTTELKTTEKTPNRQPRPSTGQVTDIFQSVALQEHTHVHVLRT